MKGTLKDLVDSMDLDQVDQLLKVIRSKEQTRKHKLFIKMLDRRKLELETESK